MLNVTYPHALQLVEQTLELEAQAIQQLRLRFQQPEQALQLQAALRLLLACQGRIVVSGMGKSGHIARKIAATLSSTGSPALFLHPAEASHGDLGMVTARDTVIAISNSGASEELLRILPRIKRLGAALIAFTGNPDSPLAKHSDVVLDTSVAREACPLDLAPTSSTIVQMALGDALAIALLDARGFSAEDFARSHPGGSLGRTLIRVADVMRAGSDMPQVMLDDSFSQLLAEMSRKGLGMTAVLDQNQVLQGVFTDGDLRRLLETKGGSSFDFGKLRARDVLHANPRVIRSDALASLAVRMMEQHRVNQLLVVDENHRLVGAINTHDLLVAKVL